MDERGPGRRCSPGPPGLERVASPQLSGGGGGGEPAGGAGDLLIGEHVVINAGCVLYTGHGIRIGNHVAIAANCTFAPVNHAYAERSRLIREQGFLPSKGGIVIEDDVWIGANCVLLDGAVLRRGCVVGAGSIVRGELQAYTVYAGQPLAAMGERR